MSPQTLAKAIDSLIDNADSNYAKSIGRIQASLYNQLANILKDLETDGEGYILQNNQNRRILNTANNKITEVYSSTAYVTAVSNYVNVIPKIDLQNVKYFRAISDTFKPNKIFIKNLQGDAIRQVESFILRDGLRAQVITPLSQILNSNVNTGGRFSGFLQQIKDFVTGTDKVESRALSYSRNYLKDALFQYSRAYQESVTSDLKLNWYNYLGGLIDTSRPFCVERAGRFFHRSEVESWANLNWSGKIAGTSSSSIFIFAGGHGCGHSIVPVSELIVPKIDLDRIK